MAVVDTETTTTFAIVMNTPAGKKTITTSSGATVADNISKSHCTNFVKMYSRAYYGNDTTVTLEDAYYFDKSKRYIDIS